MFSNQIIFLNPKETLNVPDNTHVADFDNKVCLDRVLRRAIHMMILYSFSDLIEHRAYKANKFWDTIVKVDMPMQNERYLLIGNIENSKSFLMNMQEGVDNTDASAVSSLSDTVTEYSIKSSPTENLLRQCSSICCCKEEQHILLDVCMNIKKKKIKSLRKILICQGIFLIICLKMKKLF